jgi:hypothetical protein
MNWFSMLGSAGWELRMRELEISLRRLFRLRSGDPDAELPGAELSDSERREALHRAAAGRTRRR